MNYTTLLNFEKFHKVEFNLKFDETTTIGFIMSPFFRIRFFFNKL